MAAPKSKWMILGPGLLIAATGVGAGDLATGAFAGSQLGLSVLWAVLIGAIFKFALNEGLARWQLATGSTLLEGCSLHFGRPFQWLFLAYLLLWTFFVSAALMSACGVVTHSIVPVFEDPRHDKILWGLVHSFVAVVLVWLGGYKWFERLMSLFVAIMFATVITTAALACPDWPAAARGALVPSMSTLSGDSLGWTVALLGGVGGTLTIVCYGYWIRETGLTTADAIPGSRWDLAIGYGATAVFGMAMVILGSVTELDKSTAAEMVVRLARQLEAVFPRGGSIARTMFLVGAWGAVASSLLGVWQCIPYLFTDLYQTMRRGPQQAVGQEVRTDSWPYRGYLLGMAIIPAVALQYNFQTMQKINALCGAMMIPLLAILLLALGRRAKELPKEHKNPWWSQLLLSLAALFFLGVAVSTIWTQLAP